MRKEKSTILIALKDEFANAASGGPELKTFENLVTRHGLQLARGEDALEAMKLADKGDALTNTQHNILDACLRTLDRVSEMMGQPKRMGTIFAIVSDNDQVNEVVYKAITGNKKSSELFRMVRFTDNEGNAKIWTPE